MRIGYKWAEPLMLASENSKVEVTKKISRFQQIKHRIIIFADAFFSWLLDSYKQHKATLLGCNYCTPPQQVQKDVSVSGNDSSRTTLPPFSFHHYGSPTQESAFHTNQEEQKDLKDKDLEAKENITVSIESQINPPPVFSDLTFSSISLDSNATKEDSNLEAATFDTTPDTAPKIIEVEKEEKKVVVSRQQILESRHKIYQAVISNKKDEEIIDMMKDIFTEVECRRFIKQYRINARQPHSL